MIFSSWQTPQRQFSIPCGIDSCLIQALCSYLGEVKQKHSYQFLWASFGRCRQSRLMCRKNKYLQELGILWVQPEHIFIVNTMVKYFSVKFNKMESGTEKHMLINCQINLKACIINDVPANEAAVINANINQGYLCSRHYFKPFTCIVSFHPYNNLNEAGSVIIPFYR